MRQFPAQLDHEAGLEIPGAEENNPETGLSLMDGQSPEICIMSQDPTFLSVSNLEQFGIGPAPPALFLDIQDIAALPAKMCDHLGGEVLIRKEFQLPARPAGEKPWRARGGADLALTAGPASGMIHNSAAPECLHGPACRSQPWRTDG